MRSLLAAPVLDAGLIATLGPAEVADALAAEVAVRCELPDGSRPFSAQFLLTTGSGPISRHLMVNAAGAAVTAGGQAPASITIRADLPALHQALFGADRLGVATLPEINGPFEHVNTFRCCFDTDLDLTRLAIRYGSDKWGIHRYTRHYARHLAPLRDQPLTILEIGVGGYSDTGRGGGSLRMWERYFRRALIYGIDLFDKPHANAPRIQVFTGSQADPQFLAELLRQTGPLDLVIDDGSHISRDVIASFGQLFPALRPGGLYIVEDLQTSYWPGWGGSDTDLDRPDTSVGFLKARVDGLNYEEFTHSDGGPPGYTDRHITGLHFYHNLAVVEKGVNAEGGAPDFVPRAITAAAGSLPEQPPGRSRPVTVGAGQQPRAGQGEAGDHR
jgi:hypothetical protein